MKRILIGLALLASMSSFGSNDTRALSTDAQSQEYEENGIIITISDESAKFMYLKGMSLNGLHDAYSDKKETVRIEQVIYGGFKCKKLTYDAFSFIPGETVSYECVIFYGDREL